MKKTLITISLIIALTFIIGSSFAKGNQITCTGSTTVLPVAQATAEAFMDRHPEVNISVRGGGSGVGVAALQNKTADICNSSRPMKAKEISAAKSKGINPTPYAIANDAISIVVHKSNKIKNLSVDQIKKVYTGKIKNWKDLGGENLPIVIISRDVASGTFEVFNEKALSGAKVDATAQLLASNNAVVSAVSSTPGAIGYAGLGYVTDNVNVVMVNNVMPSETSTKDGSYPLARKLYMYTNGKAKGDVARYISFIQSAEGQALVEQQGFISLN